MEERIYWIWLSLRCGAGSSLGTYLLKQFGTPKAVFDATEEELRAVEGISDTIAAILTDRDLSLAERIYEYCQRTNAGLLTIADAVYPERLRAIHAAPILLYYRGRIPNIDDNVLIACVGTRKCTENGRRMARRLGEDLAYGGAIVVSGMAAGIDTASHEGALAAGGHTIAVLGCGLDRAYPAENEKLMKTIAQEGLLLSEFAPGTEPNGKNFPVRNRIIAGLCQGTVVVEADRFSGSLITAHDAQKQGRDIFAVPGRSTDALAEGGNLLIREGAKLVTRAADILEEYELDYPHRIFVERIPRRPFAAEEREPVSASSESAPKVRREEPAAPERPKKAKKRIFGALLPKEAPDATPLSEEESLVLSCISDATSVDEIAKTLAERHGRQIATGELLGILTMLEIGGRIEALPGGIYRAL